MDDQVDEDLARATKSSAEDTKFDAVVGELEDMLMDPYFIELHDTYLADHCAQFSDDEENKLVTRKDSLEGDVFDVLSSLADFDAFKELMLSYKQVKAVCGEGETTLKNGWVGGLAKIQVFSVPSFDFPAKKKEQEGTSIDLSGLLAVHGAGH
ncbi:ADP-ribosylation factor-like protein 2-binding protein [Geranomyces variabilis]|uniref:ADP-ribosylation factor-like protein 2-binding protein n=1 Tax=Geranomyces variabilis TaxID=109894 RepID=A0AAD5TSC4_9FUNG|nr:ADP-ribosylation factor-like protein 2-binding protein [Geranomyces variabilis]